MNRHQRDNPQTPGAAFKFDRNENLIEWLVDFLAPFLKSYFRPVVRGLDRIPEASGIYVGNHNGGVLTPETFVFCVELYRRQGLTNLPIPLAHDNLMKMPGLGWFLLKLGALPASPENADLALSSGHKILVYPGGDVDCMKPYRDRNRIIFGGRRGYIRQALAHNIPVIPMVSAGAHETFYVIDDGREIARRLHLHHLTRVEVAPITLCMPWIFVVGPFFVYWPLPTKIFLEVLEPIRFRRHGEEAVKDQDYVEACHQQVHTAMEKALQQLSEERDQEKDVSLVSSGMKIARRVRASLPISFGRDSRSAQFRKFFEGSD